MCLILCALQPSPTVALLVAANRDEFYARPALAADFWPEHPGLLAGRDQEAGGTWLGVTGAGRFAAITNFSEMPPNPLPNRSRDEAPPEPLPNRSRDEAPPEPLPNRSRGQLPTNFLAGQMTASAYIDALAPQAGNYRGFNLLLWDGSGLWHYGNRCGAAQQLPAGYHGLSNQGLDCRWPKVTEGKARLQALAQRHGDSPELVAALFALLADRGDGRQRSGSFIHTPGYGTRAATLVIVRSNGEVYFEERSFSDQGEPAGQRRHLLQPSADGLPTGSGQAHSRAGGNPESA